MGLYKRGSTWSIQYFAHGKRVREAIGPSKRQAQLVLAKRLSAIREGRFFESSRTKPIAFYVLAERYLKEHVALHLDPRTHVRYAAAAKVLREYFGDTPAGNIQPEAIEQFVASRGKSGATINVELAFLSSLYTWAQRLKLVSRHPVKGTRRLKANRKDRYLSQEEIQQLLSSLTGDLHDTAVVALGTGMRDSEIVSLDRDHVDLVKGSATLMDTKNGDKRVIPLPPQVVEALRQRPTPIWEYFPNLTYKSLSERFSRAAKGAGFSDVTFHTLRHTFASHSAMSGMDLYTLAKILGHRDLKQVQRYAHLSPSHLQTAVNQVANVIFAGNVPHQVPHTTESAA